LLNALLLCMAGYQTKSELSWWITSGFDNVRRTFLYS
jgi:hypothetical protein